MASYVEYIGDGVTQNRSVPFDYINPTDISVTVDGVTTAFTFISTYVININPAPANGTTIRIQRSTPTTVLYNLSTASPARDLVSQQRSYLQCLYRLEELADSFSDDVIAPNSITTSQIQDLAVTNAKLASGIDGSKLLNTSILAGKYAPGSIVDADIGNVDGSKIIDGSITSAKYGTGSIPSSAINSIDGDKIQAGTIPAGSFEAGAVADADISNVSGAKLNSGSVPPTALGFTLETLTRGSKNFIDNNEFRVYVRPASTSLNGGSSASGTYFTDRWRMIKDGTGGTWTIDQVLNTNWVDRPHEDFINPFTAIKFDVTSVGTSTFIAIRQNVEDLIRFVQNSSTDYITLSFYVNNKAASAIDLRLDLIARPIAIAEYSCTPKADTTQTHTVPSSSGWVRISTTFQMPTNPSSVSSGHSLVVELRWTNPSALGNQFQITGAQLELGETATKLERKQFNEEFRQCQRYFQRIGKGFTGTWTTANVVELAAPLPAKMRTTPTMALISATPAVREVPGGSRTGASSTIPFILGLDDLHAVFQIDGFSGATAGNGATSVNNLITLDAELP